jgi:hypothetical protein
MPPLDALRNRFSEAFKIKFDLPELEVEDDENDPGNGGGVPF